MTSWGNDTFCFRVKNYWGKKMKKRCLWLFMRLRGFGGVDICWHILSNLASTRQLLHCELCQAQQESHDGEQWPRSSQGNSGGQLLRAIQQLSMTKRGLLGGFCCCKAFWPEILLLPESCYPGPKPLPISKVLGPHVRNIQSSGSMWKDCTSCLAKQSKMSWVPWQKNPCSM